MAGKWKKYKDARARTKELKKWAKQSAQTQGIGMKMPKGLSFNKSGGVIKKGAGGSLIKSQIKKGYRQFNASKAAQVTNYIKARKKDGVSHDVAKAEAYKKFNVKNRPDPGMMKELGNWKPDLTKRVKGGRITYKMTGGQVVSSGYD